MKILLDTNVLSRWMLIPNISEDEMLEWMRH